MPTSRHVQITRPQWKGKEVEKNLTRHNQAEIGSYLRQVRNSLGLTQTTVGDAIDVQKTAISSMETGVRMMGPDKMVQLGVYYGLDPVEYGKFLLRFTNPWQYGLIYGTKDPELRADLGLPARKVAARRVTTKSN